MIVYCLIHRRIIMFSYFPLYFPLNFRALWKKMATDLPRQLTQNLTARYHQQQILLGICPDDAHQDPHRNVLFTTGAQRLAWHGMTDRPWEDPKGLGTYKNLGMLDGFQANHERN